MLVPSAWANYKGVVQNLYSVAKKSLEANRVQSQEGALTVAGGHQFKSFWVRDFCYSVPGLLALGHLEQVKNQLSICFKYQRADGLIARGFDVVNPKLRVLLATFQIHELRRFDYAQHRLIPEYLGEHGTPAVDSNLLTLLACLQWQDKTGDRFFLQHFAKGFERALDFVLASRKDGLLSQPAFSDWQDSARREGESFYLNVLFYRVLRRLQNLGVEWAMREDLNGWRDRLWKAFFSEKSGLFRSQVGREQVSLETQIWCIEENLFAPLISQEKLWENLRKSDLWNPLPGRPVWPDYPKNEVSWTTKTVGLRHYHDRFYWSWLLGESLKVARLMKSSVDAARIEAELERLATKHETIHEIYEMDQRLEPVKRALYRSEQPFSWGAAKIVEALEVPGV